MIALAPQTVLAAFAIFCRIGGCLLIAPGFSSSVIPARVRLFIALAISLALTPMLLDTMRAQVGDGDLATLLPLIVAETLNGAMIGLLGRLFFMALQTIGVAVTQSIGLGAIPGTVMTDDAQSPALATLFTLTATTLMFITGLHEELLRGLIDSYSAIPPGHVFASRIALAELSDQATAAFLVALRIASPFIVYSIVVNVAIGVTNKLTPQIPVYFIAVPFVMAGGLMLLALTMHEFFLAFVAAFNTWLVKG